MSDEDYKLTLQNMRNTILLLLLFSTIKIYAQWEPKFPSIHSRWANEVTPDNVWQETAEELLENYQKKFDQIVAMQQNQGLSAAVYTQTTDVEGEVNGLMTYDRAVIKIPVEKLAEIHSVLYQEEK